MLHNNLERVFNSIKFKLIYRLGDISIDIQTNSSFFSKILRPIETLSSESQAKYKTKTRPVIYYLVDYENSFYPIFAQATREDNLVLVWKEPVRHKPSVLFLQQNKHRIFYLISALRLKDADTIKMPFTLPVNLLLSLMKLLILHASCVAKDGKGILITGPLRSGKTTVAFYLALKKGFDFVSNDTVLLSNGGAGVKARGIIDPIGLRRGTFKLFPQIRGYVKNPKKSLNYINPEQIFLNRMSKETLITHIFFPRPSSKVKNLFQIATSQVLHELIDNSGLLPVKTMMDERLELLGKLASSTKGFYIPWRQGELPKIPLSL
jgi:hypothetical protein